MKSNKLIMRHPVIFFFVFVLLFPVLAFADANRIFKENSKAVVVIGTYDGKGNPLKQGSGFIVKPDGAVVTNYHVITDAINIKIKVGDKIIDIEGIIHTDKENDLVILKAKGNNLPIVRLGNIEKANIGEKVYVISSPQGLENTISDGILSGIRKVTEKRKFLQITASISSGSSGSPVFNEKGEVIGIATFLLKESQNLNFAMPINLIVDKINNTKVTKLKDSLIEDYEETADYYYNVGVTYLESDKYQEAIDAYKQAIRIKPDYADAYSDLGLAYGVLKKYQEAIDAFKQAIRFKPDYADAHYYLGAAYFESDKYQEAIDAFKQAIRIKPDDADAHHNLGRAYYYSVKNREAIDAFKQAIKFKPNDAEIYFELGRAYYLAGLEYFGSDKYQKAIKDQEAIDAYKQAVRIKPDYADAHYNLGKMYKIIDDKGSALDQYKILKDLDKEKANDLFEMIYR